MHHVVIQGGESRKNKILVHCHAGQGRTAIVIGAYLLYADIAKNSDEAIKICQEGRDKLFHTEYNKDFLREFETYLRATRALYPVSPQKFSLESLIKRQRDMLQGLDAQVHKHVPKLLKEAIARLIELLNTQASPSK